MNNFGGLSTDWVGGKKCVYVFLGFFHFGGGRAHKQNLQRNLGQSLENIVYVFFLRQTSVCFWVKWGEKLGKQGEKTGNVSKSFGIWKIQLKMGEKTGAKQQKFAEKEGKKVKKTLTKGNNAENG